MLDIDKYNDNGRLVNSSQNSAISVKGRKTDITFGAFRNCCTNIVNQHRVYQSLFIPIFIHLTCLSSDLTHLIISHLRILTLQRLFTEKVNLSIKRGMTSRLFCENINQTTEYSQELYYYYHYYYYQGNERFTRI